MQSNYNNRRIIISIIFVLIGFIFILRLFYLQVINKSYKLSAENNVLRHITQYPARGLIYDRNGVLMVYNEAVYDLMVIPKQVKPFDTMELSRIIDIPKQEIITILKEAQIYSSRKPSIFTKQLSKETNALLQEKLYKFPGFYLQPRTVRKYPQTVAAQTLGYVGEVSKQITEKDKYYKAGDYIGITGIEESYERELRGRKGTKIMLVDVFNRIKGNYEKGKYDTTAIAGSNLYTSIDVNLQHYGEQLLNGKIGSIVAIEPKTGEVLAIVSSPNYDPNLLVGRIRNENYNKLAEDKTKPLFNRALLATYPPGSTFKVVNALLSLQEGFINKDTYHSCGGAFAFSGVTVGCHGHKSPLSLSESVQHSCNTYYCKVFRSFFNQAKFNDDTEIGLNLWLKYIKSFGFAKRFDDDFVSESHGNLPTPDYYNRYHGKNRWKSITIISLAIGQGEILATPLQLANLAAIIANKGYYYTPHVVRAIGTSDKLNKRFKEKHNTLVDSAHYNVIIEGMENAVKAGTATLAQIDSISVCGKTGTAQNPHGENHSIFIAFAPKDNPKIAISVVVENAGYGGSWAAPIAGLLIEKYLKGDINRLNPNRVALETMMMQSVLIKEENSETN